MRIEESIFMLISKDRKMIAKGTPSKRYICMVDEGDNKRYLTYKSRKMCESACNTSGYFVSDSATEYINREYPERVTGEWVFWKNIKDMFEVKEFLQETKIKE